ncbi:hypothetical protein CYMTET_46063 [Cymbomonas tetramitiformis]|uniref:Uncharacterized protein n=1 Tax=Cymbomonas tetramitiformis TaxID=36881 RepID=A0AAE0BY80_9CHLO|nr:hypothetical protein CYMTET_46063 [Cymbomonas tetramitiformis]
MASDHCLNTSKALGAVIDFGVERPRAARCIVHSGRCLTSKTCGIMKHVSLQTPCRRATCDEMISSKVFEVDDASVVPSPGTQGFALGSPVTFHPASAREGTKAAEDSTATIAISKDKNATFRNCTDVNRNVPIAGPADSCAHPARRSAITKSAEPDATVFVTADSNSLMCGHWWVDEVGAAVERSLGAGRARAAVYLGASNGDEPVFFEMFVFAAQRLGFTAQQCHHVKAASTPADVAFIANQAALVLLAGGDTHVAWTSACQSGIDGAIRRAADAGAVLVGVSAGAIQLGTHGYGDPEEGYDGPPYQTLGLLPFVVGAHQEEEGWAGLHAALASINAGGLRGAGIPTGLALPFGSGVGARGDGTWCIAPKSQHCQRAPLLVFPPSICPPPGIGTTRAENGFSSLALEYNSSYRLVMSDVEAVAPLSLVRLME